MKGRLISATILSFALALLLIPGIVAITGSIGNAKIILLPEAGDTILKSVLVKNVNDETVNITITASGDLASDITILDEEFQLLAGEEKNAEFSIEVKNPGNTESRINVKFDSEDGSSPGVMLIATILINATGSSDGGSGGSGGGNSNTNTLSSFCELGSIGDLKIKDIKIDNNGQGDDEEWMPLDIIEIEVEIENKGDDEIEDIVVELGLFDSDGEDQTDELEFESNDEEEMEIGDLDEDDEDTVTFIFKVPADINEDDYKLMIKAYSEDLGEDVQCIDTSSDFDKDSYQKIEVKRENDEENFIAFDNLVVPSTVRCGELVTMNLDVANIGDKDQDVIKVILSGDEFETTRELTNIDEGDTEEIVFTFDAPEQEGELVLILTAEYDYKRGVFREKLEDPTIIKLDVDCSQDTIITDTDGRVDITPGTTGVVTLEPAADDITDTIPGNAILWILGIVVIIIAIIVIVVAIVKIAAL